MRFFKGCPKCGGTVYPERQLGNTVDYCCLQCGRRLNEQAPRFFLPLTEIPRNANGKILRDALIVLARNGQSASGVA